MLETRKPEPLTHAARAAIAPAPALKLRRDISAPAAEAAAPRSCGDVGAPPSDAALVAGCLRGEAKCWEALVHRYQRLIFAVVRRIGLDEHTAADVFQTVFSRLFSHSPIDPNPIHPSPLTI